MSITVIRQRDYKTPLQQGFTLVELMIAMLLGLFIIGGVISLFVSNSQTYRTTEAMSYIQESSRTAFELLARDIRQASGTICGNQNRIANVLNNTGAWWLNWVGLTGYAGDTEATAVAIGTAVAERVDGTDALLLQGMGGASYYIASHNGATASVIINSSATDFIANDILMVCDYTQATIFQATGYDANTMTISHADDTDSPGNCTQGLGFPTDCSSTTGNTYTYEQNDQISRLNAVTWYVGNNGRADDGGRSLYRIRLGRGAALLTEEVIAGVTDMQLTYRMNNTTTFTDTPTNWNDVNAIRISLTIDSATTNSSTDTGTNNGRLQRNFTTTVALRNRIE
jgi:type IV pilus assembly protein PilW